MVTSMRKKREVPKKKQLSFLGRRKEEIVENKIKKKTVTMLMKMKVTIRLEGVGYEAVKRSDIVAARQTYARDKATDTSIFLPILSFGFFFLSRAHTCLSILASRHFLMMTHCLTWARLDSSWAFISHGSLEDLSPTNPASVCRS